MRKLIVSMNITLDGYMAGPNCELDWHFRYWDDEMARYAGEQLSKADTILLGRVTYGAMARYWPSKTTDLLCPREDIAFAEMMNNYRKVVFSKTLTSTAWNNSQLVKRNMRGEVLKLKKQSGKDLIIYGSGQIVSALHRLSLVDEFHLWVHPVAIGVGKPLFGQPQERSRLRMLHSKPFTSGVIVVHYQSLKDAINNTGDMETHLIDKDITVFCVTADSFPEGIMEAHQKLHAVLPSTKGRKFFGISRPNEKGKIIYKAAVEESREGEAKKYGLETFTIPKGEYISETLTGWRKDEAVVGTTFQKLLADPRIDQDGFCLEEYLGENDMRCMVKLNG